MPITVRECRRVCRRLARRSGARLCAASIAASTNEDGRSHDALDSVLPNAACSLQRSDMRNTVSFHLAAPLAVVSDEDGVLRVAGADWFLDTLRTIPGIELDQRLVQEDWGVIVCAHRDGRRYRIGLSSAGHEHEWVAHVRPRSFAWVERFSPGGRAARTALIGEVDRALRAAHASGLRWFDESDLNLRAPAESPH